MQPDTRLIRRIIARCAALGVVCAALFGALAGRDAGYSSAMGTAVAAANISLMSLLARLALDPDRVQWQRVTAGLFLAMKPLALFGGIAWLLLAQVVQPIAFLTGLMMLLVSIVLAVLTQGPDDGADTAQSEPPRADDDVSPPSGRS